MAMPRKRQVNIRLTDELYDALVEAAAALGISQAAVVEQALRERLPLIIGRPVPPAAPRHLPRVREDADDEQDSDSDC